MEDSNVLKSLTTREKRIIESFYGIGGHEVKSWHDMVLVFDTKRNVLEKVVNDFQEKIAEERTIRRNSYGYAT